MSKKQKRTILRVGISAVLLVLGVLLPLTGYWRLAIFLPAYFVVGGDVLWRAVRNIFHGQIFDENFLMALATVGAFAVGEYPEGVLVMLLYQVGELFQAYAVGRSRSSIASLMDIRPDYANLSRGGSIEKVDPEEVAIGDLIVVKAGEKIPLDGVIVEGEAMVDTSALTGESVPRKLQAGDEAMSGCISQNGVLTIRVTREFGESTVSKILDLVENASSKKARTENFITKFARYYTPAVVICAVLLACLPPLFLPGATLADWGYRALTFLVISCPCALVISVPLGFFGGIGGASSCGVLVKGSNYLEALAKADTVVFDKTGTLTKGNFTVTEILPDGVSKEQLLEYAALAEYYSDHPVSHALRTAYGRTIDLSRLGKMGEIPGHGIEAEVDGKKLLVGNRRLMEKEGIACPAEQAIGTTVYLAADGRYLGSIVIADQLKEGSKEAIERLRKSGVKKTVLLTGDVRSTAETVGMELGLDEVHAELLPGDKVACVERLLDHQEKGRTLAFVGDGINDAPVLSRADVGVAMGALGSDAAIEAADVVLMDDDPRKLSTAIGISRHTLRIVKQNIIFALGIKFFFLVLGAFGLSNMLEAVFADVGVSVLAILNSMRALRVSRFQK